MPPRRQVLAASPRTLALFVALGALGLLCPAAALTRLGRELVPLPADHQHPR
jgi:hypothetical protein